MEVVFLAVLNGEQAQTKICVQEESTITIGRGTGCDLSLSDPNISRLHCVLIYQEGTIWLEDQKSFNGTYVNNVKITETSLLLGDIIQVGPIFVQLIEGDPSWAKVASGAMHQQETKLLAMYRGTAEKSKRKNEQAAKEEILRDKSKYGDSSKESYYKPPKHQGYGVSKEPRTVISEKPTEERRSPEKYKTGQEPGAGNSKNDTEDHLTEDNPKTIISKKPILQEGQTLYGERPKKNEATGESNTETAGKTIIVASESPHIRQSLKKRLEQEKFTVIDAENGDQALDQALECKPCLIIAEDDMPVMDGWSMCANIKRYNEIKDVPVLLISSFTDLNERIKNVTPETVDFISKPMQLEEVVARVYMSIKKLEAARYTQRIRKWPSLDGDLMHFPITDLIQSFAFTQRTGTLNIHRETGEESFLFFDQGNIINAKLDRMGGKKALIRILSWKDGMFHLETKPPSCGQEIFGDSMSILLDSMRIMDELKKMQDHLPPPEQTLRIDFSRDFFQWGFSEAHPQQIKLLSLINIYQTIEEIIVYSDMDDLSVVNGIIDFISRGFVK
jgi:pSer/pThr/pTyr-binding forkhead associated (FHA) protein/CheY-like chemotaxis protein